MDEWLGAGSKNGWLDEWMAGWLAKWTAGWMNEWLNGWTAGRMARWLDGWLNTWQAGWMAGLRWLDEWMDRWLYGWMAERKGGWLEWGRDERKKYWMFEAQKYYLYLHVTQLVLCTISHTYNVYRLQTWPWNQGRVANLPVTWLRWI